MIDDFSSMNSSVKKGVPSAATSSNNNNIVDDFTSYNDNDQPSEAPRSKFSIG